MPQLHLYVTEHVAEVLRQRARSRGMSLSGYLAEIVTAGIRPEWPDGYFEELFGAWEGDFPEISRIEPEERTSLDLEQRA